MKQTTQQLLIAALFCVTIPLQAQILAGDPRFSIVNEIQWDMNKENIKNLLEERHIQFRINDSMLVFQTRFFENSAGTKIQFEPGSQTPSTINIGFNDATQVMQDTLLKHFTTTTGKKPILTTKEKSALIFTVKMEVATWKISEDVVSIMTMRAGGSMLGLSVLISRSSPGKKIDH
jgi:hypothetical protein